jgi:hypothetical protein
MAPNRTIDARTAYWSSADTYPVELRDFTSGRQWPNVCWVGGNITTPYPDTDPWSRWHGRTAMFVLEPLPKIVDTTVSDTGDAFSFQSGATNWSMSGVHASDVHDDCVENDGMNAGIVYDSLFEGVDAGRVALEPVRTEPTQRVTHLTYAVRER